MATDRPVRILTIAGSDSGGGAGIQADIKTVSALGGFAMSAITSVTSQDTKGIASVVDLEPAFVGEQIRLPLKDIGVDGIKVGMLRLPNLIDEIVDVLDEAAEVPLVIDPILSASDGTQFQSKEVMERLRAGLLPLADVVTPNIAEATALTGHEIACLDDMKVAADKLLSLGCQAVLLTGGHLPGSDVFDVLASQESLEVMIAARIESTNTHGTGCTLSAALTTFLAQGFDLREAASQAREFVREAIEHAPGFGSGHGPLNHQYATQIEDVH